MAALIIINNIVVWVQNRTIVVDKVVGIGRSRWKCNCLKGPRRRQREEISQRDVERPYFVVRSEGVRKPIAWIDLPDLARTQEVVLDKRQNAAEIVDVRERFVRAVGALAGAGDVARRGVGRDHQKWHAES